MGGEIADPKGLCQPREEAWTERMEAVLEGMRANFIGRQALIQNKKATRRPQGLADLAALGEDPESG